jgi:hypothetical protein
MTSIDTTQTPVSAEEHAEDVQMLESLGAPEDRAEELATELESGDPDQQEAALDEVLSNVFDNEGSDI